MAGETNNCDRVVPTCHAVGWIALSVVLPTAMGLAGAKVATVTFGLNQTCVCNNLARPLMKGHPSESHDSLDIDLRQRTAVLNVPSDLRQLELHTWQARQILITESCPPVMSWDG